MSSRPSGEAIKVIAESVSKPSIVIAMVFAASILPNRAANATNPQEKAVTKIMLGISYPTTRVYTPSAAATAIRPKFRSKTTHPFSGFS